MSQTPHSDGGREDFSERLLLVVLLGEGYLSLSISVPPAAKVRWNCRQYLMLVCGLQQLRSLLMQLPNPGSHQHQKQRNRINPSGTLTLTPDLRSQHQLLKVLHHTMAGLSERRCSLFFCGKLNKLKLHR